MESLLYDKFKAKHTNGDMVRRIWFRVASRLCFKEVYPMIDCHLFHFSAGWFAAFLSRWGLSLRVGTNAAS